MKKNPLTLDQAATAFAALGSTQRLGVILALVRAGPAGMAIGELAERTGITGANLTHHVKLLVEAGLVTRTRRGRSIICAAVAYERAEALSAFLLSECCADAPQTRHSHGETR